MKQCTKCKRLLSLDCFNKDKCMSDGLHCSCKECTKRYYQDNKEGLKEYSRQYHQNNKESIKECTKQYHQDHKEQERVYWKKRHRENPKFRLNACMSSGIGRSLRYRNISKNGRHWESLVDFNLEELIIHLEGLFQLEMTWKNQGKWHLDHIKPISLFNFESINDPEFKECWNLDNLQPLWAEDNIRKSNKYGGLNESKKVDGFDHRNFGNFHSGKS